MSFETAVFETVRLEAADQAGGAVAVLTIDRPKALNALNSQVIRDLGAALDRLAWMNNAPEGAGVRALVVRGGGEKAFVAGADIAEMRAFSAQEALDFAARGQAALDRLEALPIPVIAAVNGFALGGGCELAMSCDLVLASTTAVFGQPEVKLGVIPGFGGTQRLVRRVGSMRARELIFTGRNVKAEEAAQIGLALRVVGAESAADGAAGQTPAQTPAAAVVAAAIELAAQIAAAGPVAVRLAKRAVLDTDGLELRSGLQAERTLFALCFATADQKEGMAAFVEKRKAGFFGK